MSRDDDICIAVIKGAFGVRGEVRLLPLTEDPKAVTQYGPVHMDTVSGIKITAPRPISQGHLSVRLSCVQTREEAQALKGQKLYVNRAMLPEPDEDDFYYSDLAGLSVKHNDAVVGTVHSVQNFGAGDLLEVRLESDNKTVYVPFTKACVPTVNVPDGFVVIVLSDGLE